MQNRSWRRVPLTERQTFTDFELLEEIFEGNPIIMIRPGDGTDRAEDGFNRRRTISFRDGSKLRCTERQVDGEFFFHYQWEDANGNKKLTWGSEAHEDPRYQTDTEPYHVHPPKPLHGMERGTNGFHRDLFTIIETIQYMLMMGH